MTTTSTFGIGRVPFSEVPEVDIRPGFAVLLGGDGAGKSTLLSALSSEGWQCVSYDPEFVRRECSMINDLRDGFIRHALKRIRDPYSSDFVLALLQACVVYLRDEVGRASPGGRIIVDSYYYKILAKCQLAGLINEHMFAWWRSFPQPERVIYLDSDPDAAWRRSGGGAQLNALEYYGDKPTRVGFRRFQTDLRDLMMKEVGAIPLHFLRKGSDIGQLAKAVDLITREDDGIGLGG